MDTEQFKLAFKDIKAPDKVMHAGSLHYLDPVREKYVPAMPEEEVRQKVLQYLIKVLKVPKQVIRVEYLLSKAGLDSKNRADILIGYYNPDDGHMHCLCVIECKAPDVDILTEDVKAQAIGYSDDLDTDFVVVVNGVYSCCWIYDRDKDQYNVIKKLPVYQKMIDGDVEFEDYYECPERFKYEELEDDKYYYVSMSDFSNGDIIADAETGEQYVIGTIGELPGVYCVNKGYTQFRKVDIIDRNNEYCIIKQGSAYGLKVYDHIVLDYSTVKEDELI